MKKLYTFIVASLLSMSTFAQAPEMMSYQAVVRDAADNLVASSPVGMQISILQGSPSGTAAYVETHNPTSNQNGLVSIEIGNGTLVSGDFATIDWANGPYYVKTETDPTGGTSYTITGTSQLLSVPYALHAGNAYWDKHPTEDKVRYTGQVGVRGYPGVGDKLVDLAVYSLGDPFSEGTIRLKGTNNNSSYSQWTDLKSSYDGYITSSKFSIYTRDQGQMNENFVINSLGYTGIGVSSPVANFHLQNGGFSDLLIESTGSVEDASVWLKNPSKTWRLHGDQNDDNKFKIGLWTDYSEIGGSIDLQNAMTIDTIGNVGIGVGSPSANLDIYKQDSVVLKIRTNSNGASGAYVRLNEDQTTGGYIHYKSSGTNSNTLRLGTASIGGGDTDMIILRKQGGNPGNVGINTDNPQQVLHVNDVMRLEPRATAPANPSKGDIYIWMILPIS